VILTNNDDYAEDRDPLLVRPFLLRDSGDTPAAAPSEQTWPAASTREVRSHRALEGADAATEELIVPSHRRHLDRQRLLVVAATGAAVLVGATAAALEAMRPEEDRPPAAALQDPPALATGGPPAGTPAPLLASGATSQPPTAGQPAAPPASPGTGTSATAGGPVSATTAETGSVVINSGGAATSAAATSGAPGLVAPAPPAVATVGPIRGQNGLCLGLRGTTTVDVARCASGNTQAWTLAADGTVQLLGKCAEAAGNGFVHLATCDGDATAQWTISGQLLINASTAQCLTDPSAGARSGTAVKVTTCGGSAAQRWSFP
jgi:hypothetical protein